jgi:hypothetical protein
MGKTILRNLPHQRSRDSVVTAANDHSNSLHWITMAIAIGFNLRWFIRAMSIVILPILLFAQIAEAGAQPSDELSIENLRLKIVLENSFIQVFPDAAKLKDEICESLGDNLVVENGPWGFGLFESVEDCILGPKKTDSKKEKYDENTDPFLWTLRVGVAEKNVGEISLCRPFENGAEKCEANVKISFKTYLSRMLADARFGRLIAASILDQTPFRSKATENLAKKGNKFLPQKSKAEKGVFTLPEYSQELIAIAVSVSKSSGIFRVQLEDAAKPSTHKSAATWLMTYERGSIKKDLAKLISKEGATLESEIRKNLFSKEYAWRILNREKRREAKLPFKFWGRSEFFGELRGGTSLSTSKNNSTAVDINILATNPTWLNLWSEAHYSKASYTYPVDLSQLGEGNTEMVRATRSLMATGLGLGVRLSTSSDHTFFVYPKAEFGQMEWKSTGTSGAYPAELTDVSITSPLMPGLGVVVGYQSPEKWPVKMQLRLAASALNNKNFSSYMADGSGYFDTPKNLKYLYSSLGARRGEFMIFALFQFTTIQLNSNSGGALDNFQLMTNDLIFGAGYRWSWL